MANHKILVIDDSRVIRRCVKDMLPEGQFEVLEAQDGAEGWHLIQTAAPNLIMLDFFLPKMSGWDVYQAIQKNEQYKAVPLVLMSARKEEVTEKIPEPFEEFAFVEKPFDQKQLIQGIKDAMKKAKLRRPPAAKAASPAATSVSSDPEAMAAEIAQLKAELAVQKKKIAQILQFIQKKLR